MGILKAFGGAISGTFADQWKDIISVESFDEHTVVAPGVLVRTKNGRGSNLYGTDNVLTNGSKILVPENTAAFIFSQSGIEDVIEEAGGYEYQNGQESILNGDGIGKSIINQVGDRFTHGGVTADDKRIAFVNLREIRNIKYGTKQIYHDIFYGTDLEASSFGSFSIKIENPTTFIKNFVPANVYDYSFDNQDAKTQILQEFVQSFAVALNKASQQFRLSELPAHTNELTHELISDEAHVGSWNARFGFELKTVAVEKITYSTESAEIVREFASKKMNINAYDEVSQKASNIAAQQNISEGIKEHGLGDGGGMLFGMNMANGLNTQNASVIAPSTVSNTDQNIEDVKKFKALLDEGIITQEEFDKKKKELLGL